MIENRHFLIVILLFSLLLLFPFHQSGEGWIALAEEDQKSSFKAISYNIHRGMTREGVASLPQIIHVLQMEQADFISLQEVDRYRFRSGIQDQVKMIAEQLQMNYVYEPSIQSGLAQYGNAILTRYPILEHGSFALPDGPEPRRLIWAKVITEKGNLIMTSVHLGMDRQERVKHFQRIQDFIKQFEDLPILIMGDLNILPTHSDFRDFYKSISNKIITSHIPTYFHQGTKQEVQIDYIIGRGIHEQRYYSIPSHASDHYPIILEFELIPIPIYDHMIHNRL